MVNKFAYFVCRKTGQYGLPCAIIFFLTVHLLANPTLDRKTHLRFLSPSVHPVKDNAKPPDQTAPPLPSSYPAALSTYADGNKTILLSLTDSGFLDMTLNFYHTSLAKFGIQNYLFVSADHAACEFLWRKNIHCQIYMQSLGNLTQANMFGSKDFKKKMNIRTYMIVDALELGFTVIHCDVDVVFFQNPMADVATQCEKTCDVGVMWDHMVHNAGFLIARPTPHAVGLYKEMLSITIKRPKLDDQEGLNLAIRTLTKARKLTIKTLDTEKYQNGYTYFEDGKRMFVHDTICTNCFVLHNNWIVSKEAKIYRFKEHGMWLQDEESYYSNPNNKFLTYVNTYGKKVKQNKILQLEAKALTNALAIGKILNRTLILPSFHCGNSKLGGSCPLNIRFRMDEFDKEFAGLYREHVFLQHPSVPDSTKHSLSPLHVFTDGQRATSELGINEGTFVVHQPKLGNKGASQAEVQEFLGHVTEHVLRLHTLHDAFLEFSDEKDKLWFEKKIKNGLKSSSYRQYR